MTSPKLDLPMLDGMIVGEMISSHDGVRCYPAIRRGTEEKYILKMISIPASASKLEALLLAGALPDKEAARAYFKDLAKDVVKQADLLRSLSQQEGFVAYLDSDILPFEDEIGYDVCLLGTYKQSLEHILQTEALTHADIINMGLDLCAALAACRRAGMLYVDLKPGNIFRDQQSGYRIGDVGFIALSSLKYASVPDKYRSSYTAPELMDDFAVLNTSADIYALGLILYQAYNGGVLPFTGNAPAEQLPSPMYADYEMAQILAKACHPDPSQRWQEPTHMAQALIGYMQAFGAAEMPVIPPAVDIVEVEEPVEEFLPEIDAQQLQQEMDELEEEAGELDFLAELVSDETAPNDENAGQITEDELSEELNLILAQADELIAHELPQPPVAPEPVEVPMPEPILPEEEEVQEELPEEAPEEPEEAAEIIAEEELPEPDPEPVVVPEPDEGEAETDTDATEPVESKKPFRLPKGLIIAALLILMAIGIGSFGRYYYDNIYTLHIQTMVLENTLDTLTVQIITEDDESLLQVICADSYGNSQTSAVVNGMAQFQQLKPNTRYTVRIITDESHRLTGHTIDTFTTPAQTMILSFTAGIGPEDCSVVLNFTVDGPESGSWYVRYSAPGIAEQSQHFTGYSTTIYGLTDGAEYTFTLESAADLYMAGATQVQYTATNILYAQDLQITACADGSLTAQWRQPENGTVRKWQVRCYNEDGYDVIVTTEECSYTFTDLTHGSTCTVEVTAEGMQHSVSTSVPANPITITDMTCTITDEMGMLIAWNYSGHAPEGGWLVSYSIDDGAPIEIATEANSLLLMLLPQRYYRFYITAADGSYLFNAEHSFLTSGLSHFAAYGITAEQLQASLCLWPADEIWDWTDIPQENYRNSFTYGETAGLVIAAGAEVQASENAINVQYVLVGADGVPLRMDSATLIWNGMWQDGHCCLALPYLPEIPGSYSMLLYFDGQFVCQQEITIV